MNLAEIYAQTCAAYNRNANRDQLDAWQSVLGSFREGDIRAAIREWQASTRESIDGRVMGAMFPQPAELKALILRERTQAEARERGEFVPCGECRCGWITVTCGRTANGYELKNGNTAVRRCECWGAYLRGRAA
jgi:hypothetical protein